MLGGADNTNGELPSYITGANTGENFCDGFDFDIAQTAGIQKGRPALVGSEQLFERAGAKTGNHVSD